MNPFLIDGPACISFSGGRTSGYMLWRILDAHGGKLPDDVRVVFANTGKEMPETLDFVQECSQRWGVPIVWVERGRGVVDYQAASRQGEPFEQLIKDRNYLPNPVARFCTVELKIVPAMNYMRSQGFEAWDNAVGIRADEPRRVAKVRANPSDGKKGITRIMPLADARVSVSDVSAFWRSQPFDLGLPNINGKTMHGNCDLCFLKGADQILSLIREEPSRAVWWAKMEGSITNAKIQDGWCFRSDRPSYASMLANAAEQGEMFGFDAIEDCACTD